MIKISTIIITKNEEKNIERCLNSLVEISDEIIVVDSFSNDKTEEICNKFKVRFYQNEFKGYASQRNYAAGLAKNNYVLFSVLFCAVVENLSRNLSIFFR